MQLAVAGPAHAGFDVAGLREAIERVPGAIVIPRQLNDQEFADLMAASDAAFLPYRNVTGSGVLLTAIGFGRPVIAADLPYFREVLAPEPEAGVLVDGTDPALWAQAIDSLLRAAAREPAAGVVPSGRPLLVGPCRRASRRRAGCRGVPRLMIERPETPARMGRSFAAGQRRHDQLRDLIDAHGPRYCRAPRPAVPPSARASPTPASLRSRQSTRLHPRPCSTNGRTSSANSRGTLTMGLPAARYS